MDDEPTEGEEGPVDEERDTEGAPQENPLWWIDRLLFPIQDRLTTIPVLLALLTALAYFAGYSYYRQYLLIFDVPMALMTFPPHELILKGVEAYLPYILWTVGAAMGILMVFAAFLAIAYYFGGARFPEDQAHPLVLAIPAVGAGSALVGYFIVFGSIPDPYVTPWMWDYLQVSVATLTTAAAFYYIGLVALSLLRNTDFERTSTVLTGLTVAAWILVYLGTGSVLLDVARVPGRLDAINLVEGESDDANRTALFLMENTSSPHHDQSYLVILKNNGVYYVMDPGGPSIDYTSIPQYVYAIPQDNVASIEYENTFRG